MLSAPTKMVGLNEEFSVELRATTRDSLSSLQFSLAWNATVLTFLRVDTIGGFPPSATSDEFGLSNTASGKLAFLWIDGSIRGYRVPTDSFLIFKVVFKAIGGNGTNSAVQFVSAPTQMKASNANLVSVAVTARDGSVKVGTTGVFASDTEGVSLNQNFPNPVDNFMVIPFSMKKTTAVLLEITDLKGAVYLTKKYYFEAGRQEIRVDTEGVLPSGIFIYSLHTKDGVASRLFVKK